MTEAPPVVAPRKPKRTDYTKVALAAAQASIKAQTDAHVAVLAAADDVEDAQAAVDTATHTLEAARSAHAERVASMAGLIGVTETATRLGLIETVVRAAANPKKARLNH